eukprot:364756-Chlamydomonas_euryale.AAC.1
MTGAPRQARSSGDVLKQVWPGKRERARTDARPPHHIAWRLLHLPQSVRFGRPVTVLESSSQERQGMALGEASPTA